MIRGQPERVAVKPPTIIVSGGSVIGYRINGEFVEAKPRCADPRRCEREECWRPPPRRRRFRDGFIDGDIGAGFLSGRCAEGEYRPPTIARMKCPHCFIDFHDQWNELALGTDREAVEWAITGTKCTSCGRFTMDLIGASMVDSDRRITVRIWPRGSVRPVAAEAPKSYAEAFERLVSFSATVRRRALRSGGAASRRSCARRAGLRPDVSSMKLTSWSSTGIFPRA